MRFLLDFRHDYNVSQSECSMTDALVRIPFRPAFNDGVIVRIEDRKGTSRFVMCAFGMGALSLVASTPDPGSVCVISKGEGYIIPSLSPELYLEIPLRPIQRVCIGLRNNLLVLADDTSLAAYGPTGLAWTTDHLALDGIESLTEDGKMILGRALAPGENLADFIVRARDGKVMKSAL
jgi:hypothetical protein